MEKAGTKPGTRRSKEDQSLLQNYFLQELQDIYGAEKLLVKSLPRFEKAATSDDLSTAFENHLEVTEKQMARLERIFKMLGETPQSKRCEGMEGILKEGDAGISDTLKGSSTRDVSLIISAQKIEHYEIAAYGSLTQLAKTLGRVDVADMLAETLKEEKEADKLLTSLAETHINQEAQMEIENSI